jgi:hypothetical protein
LQKHFRLLEKSPLLRVAIAHQGPEDGAMVDLSRTRAPGRGARALAATPDPAV